jgi:hypothetical protein
VVVAFLANNPGYWFLHCHIERHLIDGMAVLIREYEHTEHSLPRYSNYNTEARRCDGSGNSGGNGEGGTSGRRPNGARMDKAGPIAMVIVELIAVLLVAY